MFGRERVMHFLAHLARSGIEKRSPYPSDITDEKWEFVAPDPTLINADALQRQYELREPHNALRWRARAGAPWRLIPTNFPPWEAVYRRMQRGRRAGCFHK